MRKVEIDIETADRITVCRLQDQLEYALKQREWFESDNQGRLELEEKWGYSVWIDNDEYIQLVRKYIPSLETLIDYFGGSEKY